MQTRAARLMLLVLLLATGIAAAVFIWASERRLDTLEASRLAREEAIERLRPAVGTLRAAQQAYVDYGQRDDATFARVRSLLEQITADAAGLRSTDPASSASLEEFWTALSALKTAETQARARLAADETLAAADLLLGAAQGHVATLAESLDAFRQAEFSGDMTRRAAVAQPVWIILGAVALFWAIGLVVLVAVPRQAEAASSADALPADAPLATAPLPEAPPIEVPSGAAPAAIIAEAPVPEQRPAAAPPTIELDLLASVCSAIARLDHPATIEAILARTAELLDARGLIVWMAAGDELFAATGFGYETAVLNRLRPIGRAADNATAAAWRSGELRTVPRDGNGLGALVAPMFTGVGCVGVFAAELRHGREGDGAVRAAASIIAAQLAGVLSAWPPASSAADPSSPRPEQPQGSDRQAAAS